MSAFYSNRYTSNGVTISTMAVPYEGGFRVIIRLVDFHLSYEVEVSQGRINSFTSSHEDSIGKAITRFTLHSAYEAWKFFRQAGPKISPDVISSFEKDIEESFFGFFSSGQPASYSEAELSQIASRLPMMKEEVVCPPHECVSTCGYGALPRSLKSAIIHMNDNAGWSREQIADWIDELHEAGIINAEFEPWDAGVQ